MSECIFCKIAKKEIPANIISENDSFFSIPDANPFVKGHSLVISKKHFENVLDLPNSSSQELLDCIKKTSTKVMQEQKASGFNVINNCGETAGQLVKHVHFHIIPRKEDDGIKFLG